MTGLKSQHGLASLFSLTGTGTHNLWFLQINKEVEWGGKKGKEKGLFPCVLQHCNSDHHPVHLWSTILLPVIPVPTCYDTTLLTPPLQILFSMSSPHFKRPDTDDVSWCHSTVDC